ARGGLESGSRASNRRLAGGFRLRNAAAPLKGSAESGFPCFGSGHPSAVGGGPRVTSCRPPPPKAPGTALFRPRQPSEGVRTDTAFQQGAGTARRAVANVRLPNVSPRPASAKGP